MKIANTILKRFEDNINVLNNQVSNLRLKFSLRKKDLSQLYGETLLKIIENSDPDLFAKTLPDNVFQPAQLQNRKYFQAIIEDLLLPGSDIESDKNILEAQKLAKQGKSVLVLSAHFSNFDVPVMYTLMRRHSLEMEKLFDDIIFIAGRKLTEGSKYVKALAEMFSRLVISAKANYKTAEELQLALAINKAGQKKIAELKSSGRIFLIYPTGTRTRIDVPETCNPMREIYNYLKKFDYFLCLGMKGNLLVPCDDRPMINEYPSKDKIKLNFGKVFHTDSFLNDIERGLPLASIEDRKQAVMNLLMDQIYTLGDNPREQLRKGNSFAR